MSCWAAAVSYTHLDVYKRQVYYLYRHGLVELDKVYTVVQGEKMGRPSMISAQVILKDGQPFVKVGGPAVTLVRGEIEL